LRADVPGAGEDAHEQLAARRVIVGYQDSLVRFLAHRSFVIRKPPAAKLYFSSCEKGRQVDSIDLFGAAR
jgi:hypothetical protein